MRSRLRGAGATLFAIFALSATARAAREPAPVPYVTPTSRARVVNAHWVQLVLPENRYDPAVVAETVRYSLTSSDDPAFSGARHPAEVHHRTFPEEATYAEQRVAPTIAKLRVTYRIFLRFTEKLLEGKHYTLQIGAGLLDSGAASFSFAFDQQPNDAIHVNQVAYAAKGPKLAYLSLWTGQGTVDFGEATEFQLVDHATGKSIFSGTPHLDVVAASEHWSRSNVYSLDFSSVSSEGTYHLSVPGVGASFPFAIRATAFNEIGYTLIRGLTMQRDGKHGLDSTSVTHWTRPPAHLDDAIDESTGSRVDLTGGHMDAGDRGKYPHNTADVCGSLLAAAALFPAGVERLGERLELPESGNGIPDFLDEALYELDYLARSALNTSKGGAQPWYLRPSNKGYEMGVPPEGLTGRVWFNQSVGPYRAETLYSAGVLALAANNALVRKHAAQRAETYKQAALRLFQTFEAHATDDPFWQPDAHFYDNWTTGKHHWSDEMLVAAASLYELTGEQKYADWVKGELPADLNAGTKLWSWSLEGPWLNAFFAITQITRPGLDDVKAKARAAILAWADGTRDRKTYPAPFGAPLPEPAFQMVGWYFSASQVGFPLLLAYGLSGDAVYRDDLIRLWSYLLGANPLSRSYVSGLGQPDRRPRWQVHELAQYLYASYRSGEAGGWSELPPGILSADLQDGTYEAHLDDTGKRTPPWNAPRMKAYLPALAEHPPLYRYHDSWTTKNEFTINQLARGAASIVALVEEPGPSSTGDTSPYDGGPRVDLRIGELGDANPPKPSGCSCEVGGPADGGLVGLALLVLGLACAIRPRRSYLLLALAALLGGCRSSAPPVDLTRPSSDLAGATDLARRDASVVDVLRREGKLPAVDGTAGAWPDAGLLRKAYTLAACNGKGPGSQDCHSRLIVDPGVCNPKQPCSKLLVYWAGGEQTCSIGLYDGLLEKYAAAGFLAACAQPYSTADEAGRYPYYLEFDRMHELMLYLRSRPEVKAAWTGARLLISGVSHGASAPLMAIASKAALRSFAQVWTGSTATALILYDGISNTATLEEWAAQQGIGSGCATYHQRWVGRYGDGSPLIHSCANKACYCSSPVHGADWEKDTVVLGSTYPKSPYSCSDVTPAGSVLFRFVSCEGGAAAACAPLGDLIPTAQQKLAHDSIQGCPGVTASYKVYPTCGHSACGTQACGQQESVDWLKTQGW